MGIKKDQPNVQSLLKFIQSSPEWKGDDFEECLDFINILSMKKEESEESVYLLDTNHCSFIIIQKDTNVINKLESLPKDTIIAINSII